MKKIECPKCTGIKRILALTSVPSETKHEVEICIKCLDQMADDDFITLSKIITHTNLRLEIIE